MAVGIQNNTLHFEFPEVHPDAQLTVTLKRTLRVPDDARRGTYPLPPAIGTFPMKAIDDLPQDRLPDGWTQRGGVATPMWQAEALWLNFEAPKGYEFAVKVAAGKVNAITGGPWKEELDPDDQDYLVVPKQPWLDGFADETGRVRQFVAVPLGAGHTAEEQITRAAQRGGLQILVYPLRSDRYRPKSKRTPRIGDPDYLPPDPTPYPPFYEHPVPDLDELDEFLRRLRARRRAQRRMTGHRTFLSDKSHPDATALRLHAGDSTLHATDSVSFAASQNAAQNADMGLGAGGRIDQEIYASARSTVDFASTSSKCFVAIANALTWRYLTGEEPPTTPPTAQDYAAKGLPWYTYYDEGAKLEGGPALKGVDSVAQGEAKGKPGMLPENAPPHQNPKTVPTGPRRLPASGARRVAEGAF